MTLYNYRAFVTSVYDGDTITCDIDCGFGLKMGKQKIRLYGINTPEVRGDSREDGLISRDRLRELILDKDIILKTIKDKKGKYGRYLGIIYIMSDNNNNDNNETENGNENNMINVNDLLVKEGLASVYML